MKNAELPQDLNAEAAVLYSVLYSPETLLEVKRVVGPQDMFSGAHKAILGAAMAIHEVGSPVDIVTVGGKLSSQGKLDDSGGMGYLESLLDYQSVVSGVANTKYYARIVKEKSLLRQTIALCQRVAVRGHADVDFATLSSDLSRQISQLRESANELGKPVFIDAKNATIASVRGHAERLAGGVRLSTGLNKLDAKLGGGLHDGQVTIIAGRPGMGKTSAMTSQAISLARFGHVLIFSLEMPENEIADRILCNLSGLQMSEVCDMRVDGRAVQVQDAIHRISPRIQINDWCYDPSEIVAHIHAYKANLDKTGERISGVFVDHLGWVEHPHAQTDAAAIGKTTKMFKRCAGDLKIPFTILCQLNRAVESRDDKRPVISDLRESGNIEQDAHNIILLYRDSYYKAKSQGEDEAEETVAEFIIGKQRNGPTATVKVLFHNNSTTFKNLREDEGNVSYEPYKF